MDLLPVSAIIEVSKIFEEGARKYDARNWEKGIPMSRFLDSGIRHAMKWLRGDRDEPHLAQACWNFLCGLDTLKRIEDGRLPAELDDLPKPQTERAIVSDTAHHCNHLYEVRVCDGCADRHGCIDIHRLFRYSFDSETPSV